MISILLLITLFTFQSCTKENPTASPNSDSEITTLENISYSLLSLTCETAGYCLADYSIYNGSEHSISGQMNITLNYICANESFLRSSVCSEQINSIDSYNSPNQGSGFYNSTVVCGHDCGTRPFEQVDASLFFVNETVVD